MKICTEGVTGGRKSAARCNEIFGALRAPSEGVAYLAMFGTRGMLASQNMCELYQGDIVKKTRVSRIKQRWTISSLEKA